MQISHESPLFLLEESRAFNDYDYALVHLFKDNPEYYSFFVESLRQGREVILDNSIFELEEAFNADSFVYWINKLLDDSKADPSLLTYIVPDVLDDAENTVSNAKTFLQTYTTLCGNAMVVVQGDSMLSLSRCYRRLVNLPRVKRIGISFNCKAYESFFNIANPSLPLLEKWSLGRRYFFEHLYNSKLLRENIPFHLLGIAYPDDYKYYTTEHNVLSNFIKSADTSNPVVHGMLGIKYEGDYGLRKKESAKLAELLHAKKEDSNFETIMYNVQSFRKINNL